MLQRNEPLANDGLKDEIALVIAGDGVSARDTIKTYNNQVFCIYNSQLESVKKQGRGDKFLGPLWCSAKYSALEDHGTEKAYYYNAEGILLDGLLQLAGLSESQVNSLDILTFKSGKEFRVVLDSYSKKKRYYYGQTPDFSTPVPSMLAYIKTYDSLESTVSTPIETIKTSGPTLMFGQKELQEANKCSYLKNVQTIIVGGENNHLVLEVKIDGISATRFTLSDLLLMQWENREYIVDGETFICSGLALGQILGDLPQSQALNRLEIITSANEKQNDAIQPLVLKDIEYDKYLLAFYSENKFTGKRVANQTALRLYGPDLQIPNLQGLALGMLEKEKTPIPLVAKQPGGREQDILNSVFYVCVCSKQGPLYYYFSQEQLQKEYKQVQMQYAYNDHTVDKKADCIGTRLVDLIGSLVDYRQKPLEISDTWQIQMVESDAYHATSATYIHTLQEIRDFYCPMVVSTVKESFLYQTEYHHDEAEYHSLESLQIYQKGCSANEAVVKNLMGIVISPNGDGFIENGFTIIGRDGKNGQKLFKKTVKGVMPNLQVGVSAPHIPGCCIIDENDCRKLGVGGSLKTSKVEFLYLQKPLVRVYHGDNIIQELKYTDFKKQSGQYPLDLATVCKQAEAGHALSITQENSCPKTGKLKVEKPKGNLYIDHRGAGVAASYGYDQLFLRRYLGLPLSNIMSDAYSSAIVATKDKQVVVDTKAVESKCYILAYCHTESKGVPNNTGEGKRKTVKYGLPKLVAADSGEIILDDVEKIFVSS